MTTDRVLECGKAMRAAFALIVDELDIDPSTTDINVKANGTPLATVSLATIFGNWDQALLDRASKAES